MGSIQSRARRHLPPMVRSAVLGPRRPLPCRWARCPPGPGQVSVCRRGCTVKACKAHSPDVLLTVSRLYVHRTTGSVPNLKSKATSVSLLSFLFNTFY